MIYKMGLSSNFYYLDPYLSPKLDISLGVAGLTYFKSLENVYSLIINLNENNKGRKLERHWKYNSNNKNNFEHIGYSKC